MVLSRGLFDKADHYNYRLQIVFECTAQFSESSNLTFFLRFQNSWQWWLQSDQLQLHSQSSFFTFVRAPVLQIFKKKSCANFWKSFSFFIWSRHLIISAPFFVTFKRFTKKLTFFVNDIICIFPSMYCDVSLSPPFFLKLLNISSEI